MKNKDFKIALIVGGASPERPVSKDTSKAIYEALMSLGYNVKVIDPAYGKDQPSEIEKYFIEDDHSVVSSKNYIDAFSKNIMGEIDFAFLGLHGNWGEDGTVQSLLELNGIKYTGSGILASSLGMDKNLTKVMFQHYDVHTPKWFVYESGDKNTQVVKEKIKKFFGYPCIIKPNNGGSTIGLTVCRGETEVEKALLDAVQFSGKVLIEEFIPGRELTVGVIGQHVLQPLEIKPKHGLYDYECKYTDGMSQYIVPAEFPQEVLTHLQQQALLAYNSIGCENYARVDFRVNDKHESFCLEVNTLPGMTSHSLVPKMAKAEGISFEELIEKIIQSALI